MKKMYFSLAFIAFVGFAIDQPDLEKDHLFEMEEDQAKPIVEAGLAREATEADIAALAATSKAEKGKSKKVRLLVNCSHGSADDVVSLPAAAAASAVASGEADDHPSAVKYAESLKK